MTQEQTHKKLKLAYIAGFIDGDGCIHSSLKSRPNSAIVVGVTDFEPVQFIAKHFNKNVTKRLENSPYKVQPRYFTKCSGISVIPHLKSLLPFLMEKRNNAFKILKQYNAYENFPYLQHSREEFFAWLAGFSEAEGHFGTRKRKTSLKSKGRTPSSKKTYDFTEVFYQLVNTNESLMNYILNKLREYGITYKTKLNVIKAYTRACPVTKKIIIRKPLHRLFLGGGDLLLLYREIYPSMKIERKKDQIIKSIKLMKETKRKRKRLKEALKL
tara:strand:+ start:17 stop:826 length:810 start_codon:yes stop_codon:yes gene_type:complete